MLLRKPLDQSSRRRVKRRTPGRSWRRRKSCTASRRDKEGTNLPSVLSSKCTILTTNVTNLEVQRKNIKQIPQVKPFQGSPKIIDFHKLGLVSPLFPVSASFKVLPRMKVSILRISVDIQVQTHGGLYIQSGGQALYIYNQSTEIRLNQPFCLANRSKGRLL